VRMGQNPSMLNILNPEINRLEYIEIFSLLAKAAEMIEEGETCVELNRYEDPVFEPSMNYREPVASQPQPAPAPAKPKSPKRSGWFKNMADKLSSLMSEDDPNDDDQ